MAERRMFAKSIIDSDAFLDLPLSTQALYFHLCMRADDDGFVNNPKKIQRMIGAADGDGELLIQKRFILAFETGVIVIKHWRMHNYIQSDRYKPTVYQTEMRTLFEKANKSYTDHPVECLPDVSTTDTECIQSVSILDTQVRLGKVRLGKESLGEDSLGEVNGSTNVLLRCPSADVQRIIDAWNTSGLQPIKKLTAGSTRAKLLKARIAEYGVDDVLVAIDKVKHSSFLKGGGKSNFVATFDWFIKPNNFPKVLEGNYDDRASAGRLKRNRVDGIDEVEF